MKATLFYCSKFPQNPYILDTKQRNRNFPKFLQKN